MSQPTVRPLLEVLDEHTAQLAADRACFVCSSAPHADSWPANPEGHRYWPTSEAMAEAREHDRQVLAAGGPVYSSGARNAEAAYVDEWIGR